MNTTELKKELQSRFNNVNNVVEFTNQNQPTHGVLCAEVLGKYPVKVVTFDSQQEVESDTANYIRTIEVNGKVYTF